MEHLAASGAGTWLGGNIEDQQQVRMPCDEGFRSVSAPEDSEIFLATFDVLKASVRDVPSDLAFAWPSSASIRKLCDDLTKYACRVEIIDQQTLLDQLDDRSSKIAEAWEDYNRDWRGPVSAIANRHVDALLAAVLEDYVRSSVDPADQGRDWVKAGSRIVTNLTAYLRRKGRSAPAPVKWSQLYARISSGVAHWHRSQGPLPADAPPAEKLERLEQQLRWADANGRLAEALRLLGQIEPDDWQAG
ncbi:hypothetical protein [Aurantiacibacter gilvus]|uniref:Uncharacterized protein n=1 Tax=Aurantiacibacter gilvus TaxID=3139141 RepID=A0ABU9II94_9SPHN